MQCQEGNINRGLIYQTTYWLNKIANVYYLSTQKLEICSLEKSRGDDSAGHYDGRNVWTGVTVVKCK